MKLLFLLLVSAACTVVSSEYCTTGCSCRSGKVRCTGSHYFNGVPQNLPPDTKELQLEGVDIRILHADSFKRYPQLRVLMVSRTQLNTIQQYAFRGMPTIERIYITQNRRLRRIEPGAFSYMNNSWSKRINLQQNWITSVEPKLFEHSSNFRLIDFRKNPIRDVKSFAFTRLFNVDFLIMPENVQRIQPDAFNRLIRVHEIKIGYWNAKGGTLPYTFRGLQRIKFLRLEASNLGYIAKNTFAEVETIESIHMQNCEIAYLSAPSFALIRNIRIVIIVNSYLAHADISLRPLIQARFLSLNNSRIACECHNFWLLSKDSGMTVQALQGVKCHDGPWHEESVWDVREPYLDKCITSLKTARVQRDLAAGAAKNTNGARRSVWERSGFLLTTMLCWIFCHSQ